MKRGRRCGHYKGSVYWKMEAGMGDVVFGPLYQVLKKRGVIFKFFHQVKNLKVSADGKSIASIEIGRQVTLKSGEYEPLIGVRGLPCWPSEPLYDQIVQGEELQKQGINLESHWSPWKDVEEIRLEAEKTSISSYLASPSPRYPRSAGRSSPRARNGRPCWTT